MKKHLFYTFCIISILCSACNDDEKLQENVDFRGLSLKKTQKALVGEWVDPSSSKYPPEIILSIDNPGLQWEKYEPADIYGFRYSISSSYEIWLPVKIENGILTLAVNNRENPLPLNSEEIVYQILVRLK